MIAFFLAMHQRVKINADLVHKTSKKKTNYLLLGKTVRENEIKSYISIVKIIC